MNSEPPQPGAAPAPLDAGAITWCFNRTFAAAANIVLAGGYDEPLYLPATSRAPAQLRFTRDYAASALHEVSHWCIAGPRRRRRVDFGYHYLPAPRSAAQQQAFLRGELTAQALESLFADSAGIPFAPSFDDLEDRHVSLRAPFAAAVAARRRVLDGRRLPAAAGLFRTALRSARQPWVGQQKSA